MEEEEEKKTLSALVFISFSTWDELWDKRLNYGGLKSQQ